MSGNKTNNNSDSDNSTNSINNKKKSQSEYYSKYYEENKTKFKEKIKCEDCGGVYARYNKAGHEKSKKHKAAINEKKLRMIEEGEGVPDKEKILYTLKEIDNLRKKLDSITKNLK